MRLLLLVLLFLLVVVVVVVVVVVLLLFCRPTGFSSATAAAGGRTDARDSRRRQQAGRGSRVEVAERVGRPLRVPPKPKQRAVVHCGQHTVLAHHLRVQKWLFDRGGRGAVQCHRVAIDALARHPVSAQRQRAKHSSIHPSIHPSIEDPSY